MMAPSNLEGKVSAGSQGSHSGVAAPVQVPSSPTEDKVFTLGTASLLIYSCRTPIVHSRRSRICGIDQGLFCSASPLPACCRKGRCMEHTWEGHKGASPTVQRAIIDWLSICEGHILPPRSLQGRACNKDICRSRLESLDCSSQAGCFGAGLAGTCRHSWQHPDRPTCLLHSSLREG